MINSISNSTLITLVLITAVLMLVFLVFSARNTRQIEAPPVEQPAAEQASPPKG